MSGTKDSARKLSPQEIWKRKSTDTKWALILSISTRRWGHKSWTRGMGEQEATGPQAEST